MNRLKIILELAKSGALSSPQKMSSSELANRIGCSQQTASRWLSKLADENLISGDVTPQGHIIEITQKGENLLKSTQEEISEVLEGRQEETKLVGKLVSGSGEGGYYVGQRRYQEQFKDKLGFEPHPGTVDLKLDNKSLRLKERLKGRQGKKIEGFSTEERTFGQVKCIPARVKGEKAAVVLPSRTHHEENIIEVISPTKILEKYDLEDGDKVEVEVKS